MHECNSAINGGHKAVIFYIIIIIIAGVEASEWCFDEEIFVRVKGISGSALIV